MAIIYTYPVKTNPVGDDLILISDSADENKTKQVKVSTLPSSGGGSVSSVGFSLNSLAAFTVTGDNPVTGSGTITLGVTGGSSGQYLDYQGNWSTPSGSGGDTYTLQAEAKSSNSVPLKLDAATGTDSTVNLTEGSGVTLTRTSATEITIAATGSSGVSQVTAGGVIPSSTGAPLLITPTSGNVVVTSARYNGGSNEGHVPLGGSNTTFLRGDATWVTPTNTTYSAGTGLSLVGTTFSLATGAALTNLGGGSGTTFLRKDGTWQTVSASASPSGNNTEIQYNNNGSFGASANLTFATNTLAVTHTVDIKGDGTNAGKLKLYCQSTSVPHAVTIEGPDHANAAAYTLKLPSPAPTTNQLLEYENSTNNLRWINTPTAGVSPTSGTWYATLANASGQSYAANATQAQIAITTNDCQWYRVGDMMYYQFYIAGTIKSSGTLQGNLFLCRSLNAAGTTATYGLPTVSANSPTIVNNGFCNGSVTITESEAPAQALTWTYPVNGGRVGRDTNYPGYVQLFSLFSGGTWSKVYYPLSNQTWLTNTGEDPANWALGGTINALVEHVS